ARGRAAVTRGRVAVVALLGRRDDEGAAHGLDRADRRTAVARDRIAVVALLGRLDDRIATHGLDRAGRRAAIAGDGVAVIALLARLERTIAADPAGPAIDRAARAALRRGAVAVATFGMAACGAAVAPDGVAVVALLAGGHDPVAASGRRTV